MTDILCVLVSKKQMENEYLGKTEVQLQLRQPIPEIGKLIEYYFITVIHEINK